MLDKKILAVSLFSLFSGVGIIASTWLNIGWASKFMGTFIGVLLIFSAKDLFNKYQSGETIATG